MREIISLEIITILLTCCFAVLALAKMLFAIRFDDFIAISNVTRYLKVYSKDFKERSLFHFLLSLNSLIGASVFTFFIYNMYVKEVELSWKWILTCAFILLTFFAVKYVIENLIASLFDIQKLIETYQFTKTTYRNYAGFIMVFGSILLSYVLPNSIWIIYIIIALCALVLLVSYYVIFKTNEKTLTSNLFYFILYLCALEIGPYIIAFYWYRTIG